jgi:L-iditol 2-dehydrogenase
MKAAIVHGPGDIRITEIPTPQPGPQEILVKVRACGVCATDVKILGGSGLPKELPTILGHEVAGTIAALGEGVSGLDVDERVAVYPIAACGECFFCERGRHSLCLEPYGLAHGADGGFAESLVVPKQIVRLGGVVPIDDMPYESAVMIEPVSCCLSAADQCGTGSGDNVLIIGCGPLGLIHTIVSKALGARVLAVDLNEKRLRKAAEVGADVILNPREVDLPAEVQRVTGVGADIVITAVGITKVVEESLSLVRNGGVLNVFGGTPRNETITIDPRWLHYGEIILTGTFAASLSHFMRAHQFVQEHMSLLGSIISRRCRLEDIHEAVNSIRNGRALKAVILFD